MVQLPVAAQLFAGLASLAARAQVSGVRCQVSGKKNGWGSMSDLQCAPDDGERRGEKNGQTN